MRNTCVKFHIALFVLSTLCSASEVSVSSGNTVFEKKFGWPVDMSRKVQELGTNKWAFHDPARMKTVKECIKILHSADWGIVSERMAAVIKECEFKRALLVESFGGGDIGSSWELGFGGEFSDGSIVILRSDPPNLEGVVWTHEELKRKPDATFNSLADRLISQQDFYTTGVLGSPRLWDILLVRIYIDGKHHECLLSHAEKEQYSGVKGEEAGVDKLCSDIRVFFECGRSLNKVEFHIQQYNGK